MTIPDILIGGLLIYGFIRGLWNGLFKELAAFLSLLLGIYFAIRFSGYMSDIIRNNISWNPKYINIVAFIIVFILVVIGVTILARILTKVAGLVMMGWLNKLLGGIFGFVKWILIIGVLLNLFIQVNTNNTFAEEKALKESWLFYPILNISHAVYPLLEKGFVIAKDNITPDIDADEEEITEPKPMEGLNREI